jgi:UrcA family protein
MKTITTLAALLAAALTTATGIGHVAYAQPNGRTVAVPYGDLDLSSQAGRKALDTRIGHAIRVACGTPSPADLRGHIRASECRAELRAAMAPQRDAAFASAGSSGNSLLASR